MPELSHTPDAQASALTIVIAAYNRPHSLRRLLLQLDQAFIPSPTRLVISIDRSLESRVKELAEKYHWPHGEKRVIAHPNSLGLVAHMLSCGDLTAEYGDIVLLEDDLGVAPYFAVFAAQALYFFADEPAIAGISLYHYTHTEHTHAPFHPWPEQHDLYFMQLPSSWGLALSPAQWQNFRHWHQQNSKDSRALLPGYVQDWERESWKRDMLAYLISQDKYFAYPRYGLATHFGDPGVHSVVPGQHQSPLDTVDRNWRFERLDRSLAVYDADFEMKWDRLAVLMGNAKLANVSVDLYGQKRQFPTELVWTRQAFSGASIQSVEGQRLPQELNLIQPLPGADLHLVRAEQITGPRSEQIRQTFGVVVPAQYWDAAAELTLQSLREQELIDEIVWVGELPDQYRDEVVRHWPWPDDAAYFEVLIQAWREATADFSLWLHPGCEWQPENTEAPAVFLRSEISRPWLLLPTAKSGLPFPAYRWTRDRYGRSSDTDIRQHLGPGNMVIQRELRRQLVSSPTWDGLLGQLFSNELPIPTELVLATPPNSPVRFRMDSDLRQPYVAGRSRAGRLLSHWTRNIFLQDGHYRWIHANLEQYPPVLVRDGDRFVESVY